MKKLVIFGLGETAELAYEYFTHDPDYTDYEVVAFAADADYITSETFCGLPVVPTEKVADRFPPENHIAFAAAGSGKLNRVREALYNKAKSLGYQMASYISSRAFVWHNAKIGENCFIMEDNTIQPFTEVGNNVVMWSGNHLGHRSKIEDHCFITSHVVISGYCTIGAYSFVGVNACFADKLTIGTDNFIAMGAVINKNTEDNGIYMGSPMVKKDITAKRMMRV